MPGNNYCSFCKQVPLRLPPALCRSKRLLLSLRQLRPRPNQHLAKSHHRADIIVVEVVDGVDVAVTVNPRRNFSMYNLNRNRLLSVTKLNYK
jgi:hypothetical protein